MKKHFIKEFMTAHTHTIEPHQKISFARDVMRKYGIRHLPVLTGGRLIGICSERDFDYLEAFTRRDCRDEQVQDAMSTDVLTFGPLTPLGEVASQLAEARLGSAVIVDDEKVVGIFTVTDALWALSQLA